MHNERMHNETRGAAQCANRVGPTWARNGKHQKDRTNEWGVSE